MFSIFDALTEIPSKMTMFTALTLIAEEVLVPQLLVPHFLFLVRFL